MKTAYLILILFSISSCAIRKFAISKIEFQTDYCFGKCPVFSMSILKDGTANYNARAFNKQKGQLKAVIKKAQLDSLKMLIWQANLLSLKDDYSTPWTDQPTYTIKVKFKDGRQKTIEDYGPSGPDKLEKIYDLILSLRDSQDWK